MTTLDSMTQARPDVPIVLRIRHHTRRTGSSTRRNMTRSLARGWRSDHVLFLAALPLLALAITVGWRMTTTPSTEGVAEAVGPVRIEKMVESPTIETLPRADEPPMDFDLPAIEHSPVPANGTRPEGSGISPTAASGSPRSTGTLRTADYQATRDKHRPEFVPACKDGECIPRAPSRIQSVRPMVADESR